MYTFVPTFIVQERIGLSYLVGFDNLTVVVVKRIQDLELKCQHYCTIQTQIRNTVSQNSKLSAVFCFRQRPIIFCHVDGEGDKRIRVKWIVKNSVMKK
jgi:hypothetical protein